MSYIETSFVGVTSIDVKPPKTSQSRDGELFTVQNLLIVMENGHTFQISLHLETGAHALAVGDVITNAQVTA